MALKLVIPYEALSLQTPFDGAYFEHVMSKATQYATNDDNIFKDLALIKMKSSLQASFQASITLPKNLVISAVVIFAMQTFIGCEMYNKIDPSFSLCIIDKGPKNGGEHLMILVCLTAN